MVRLQFCKSVEDGEFLIVIIPRPSITMSGSTCQKYLFFKFLFVWTDGIKDIKKTSLT